MWRNDTNGNKTLCNACGVRLQRQLNKQKQQSQAIADNSTSLIAGKLPRSRTSPAKLSRQDLPRSCSQEGLRQAEGVGQKGVARSLTLVHNSSGQPTLTIAQGKHLFDIILSSSSVSRLSLFLSNTNLWGACSVQLYVHTQGKAAGVWIVIFALIISDLQQ